MQNSPYTEVRAVVDNHDTPNMPASTFRSWVIGTLLVVAGSFLNQFFSIRYSGAGFDTNFAQLLCVLPTLITHEQRLTGYRGQRFPGR